MSNRLTTIYSYESPTEAHAAKNRLEAAGIAAFVADESAASMLSYVGSAIGGAKLQVAESDAKRSLIILFPDETQGGDAEASTPWRCKTCDEIISADFDACWSCGGFRSKVEDPTFDPATASAEDVDAKKEDFASNETDGSTLMDAVGATVDGKPNPYYSGRLTAESLEAEQPMQPTADDVEALVNRAWRAAVIGVVVCSMFMILNIYSAWLLIRVAASETELSPGGIWKYRLAWAVNILASFLSYLFHRAIGTF